MKRLRWTWPAIVIALAVVIPWSIYALRPERPLSLVVLDKTVPFTNRLEHRSLFWLLRYRKFVRPDGRAYDASTDYLGAFPPPADPGGRPERIVDLGPGAVRGADVVYLVDTYGVYEEDLVSGSAMKAALERSPKIYGGLLPEEAAAVDEAVREGAVLIAEFNTLGSPTGAEAREALERTLGVRWTRWIGRYFPSLDDGREVPEWLRRDWEREWGKPWEFRGPGYALLQDDAHCEVLRVGTESKPIGLTLERERPVDPILRGAWDATPYPYWFDVVAPGPGTRVLASFQWHLTPAGRERLAARGLPERFAAVTLVEAPGAGPAYYFAGDFADNPMPDFTVPLAGFPTWMRWLQAGRLAPSESAFYWRFYAPTMTALLERAAARRR